MNDNIIKPKGIYRDRLITSKGVRFDSGWHSNIIVNHCRDLLAAFMKGDGATGIKFIAIGKGDANWDSTAPGAPVPDTTQLEDSSPFKLDVTATEMTLAYLNASNEPLAEPVTDPTHRIEIKITLDKTIPPIEAGQDSYPLREFGLFGLFGTAEYMIDYVRHSVIHKGPEDTLVRTIRLVF